MKPSHNRARSWLACVLMFAGGLRCLAGAPAEKGGLELDSLPGARFQFGGFIGERIDVNREHWLLRAPQANPGMLEMFRVRDRLPAPQLVPWAGEFVGKYLISAVQALRLSDDPRLFAQVSYVVTGFIATQADDGYLGPFPKDVRLLKHWDLWGHYHAIYGLLLWHQHTGDPAALAAARKAADLACRIYLDGSRRVLDAGDPEMNMAILTGLSALYRLTGEARYLQLVREVEVDWEKAGDYLRAGLDGREYFQSPRPRWESLHSLQGLLELWRITGERRYRDAFVHHWRSIRRWDRRNSGAFSSGEQATGNPYANTAIETCCTVAWMALTVDYLRLTGDPQAADELELATLNGGIGAQHVSGRWWTYNTPMDGVREASAHTIVFQARAGTPELNCCSVNAPRVLGMLSEWAVMGSYNGLSLHCYLPGQWSGAVDNQPVEFQLQQDYPRAAEQRIVITRASGNLWTLRLRIPTWSSQTRVEGNFDGGSLRPVAGSYVEWRRRWKPGDRIDIHFDFNLRAVAGANEADGKVSVYRGPLLLAYDQAYNAFDEARIPALKLARLQEAALVNAASAQNFPPLPALVQVSVPTDAGPLRLVDFASAGSGGTRYRSWLAAEPPPPPPAVTQYPRDGERFKAGPVEFRWRGARRPTAVKYRLEMAGDPSFQRVLFVSNDIAAYRIALELPAAGSKSNSSVWWRVLSVNSNGVTVPDHPAANFMQVADGPPQKLPPQLKLGPRQEIIVHTLRGDQAPGFGLAPSGQFEDRDQEGTRLNGGDQMLRYELPAWPEGDFTLSLRVRVDQLPQGRIGQIFSAWAAPMDDPLRLVVDKGKVFARIENGGGYSTPGAPISAGTWHRVAAIKQGSTLSLYVDGQPVGSTSVPEFITSAAQDGALGGNPHFSGNEFLAATFADFSLWSRALEVSDLP